jgi:glycosyltransferase involved in cell wall biosynthesis
MRVLLVEPYYGGSHRAWADEYRRFSSHEVGLLTLPARWWTWRMRGGALTLAEATQQWAADHGRPDLILATDMLDLPTYLAATRRTLADIPVAVYFHESQFTYPWSPQQRPDLQYAYTNWASMVVADLVLFNSAFHRDAVFEQLPRFLRRFPDLTHEHLIDDVKRRSWVLHVGVDLRRFDDEPPGRGAGTPLVLWNQRWEHDKDPAVFFRSMFRLADDGVPFRLAVCGENFRQVPEEFLEAERRLSGHIIHFGFAPEEEYRRLLRAADVVVSTARQEFFGIAVVEATYAGARPVLPDRLSYPELIPPVAHDQVLYEDEQFEEMLRAALESRDEQLRGVLRRAVARFDWGVLAPHYDSVLSELLP